MIRLRRYTHKTPRTQTHSTTHYPFSTDRIRVRNRDPYCVVSGHPRPVVGGTLPVLKRCTFSLVRMTLMYTYHASFFPIYYLTMNVQWIRRGYSSRIPNPALLAELGGSTKIDSGLECDSASW
jgi:hypothetical protein